MELAMEITPAEVKRRLDAGEKLHLIDCREPGEFAIGNIEGAALIPMNTTPQHLQRLEEMAEEAPLIVYCHHGVRSMMVATWLREQGVTATSMSGGIDQWSLSVDPSVPRY